ncbi:hypothetical protein FDP41_011916 [Naegleria fowleri]|uniref:RGS domain-containing protein n=1 Tax=Naegleria fowleri TaxID=5763 RepID=A0A6A5C9L7_NAEFO|nr:uncharacterized protein FDP41_011916 [Naegleria fowleri]KAF0982055.1 hypothetical protein FDP41_011916 [Naegleria fowleri]
MGNIQHQLNQHHHHHGWFKQSHNNNNRRLRHSPPHHDGTASEVASTNASTNLTSSLACWTQSAPEFTPHKQHFPHLLLSVDSSTSNNNNNQQQLTLDEFLELEDCDPNMNNEHHHEQPINTTTTTSMTSYSNNEHHPDHLIQQQQQTLEMTKKKKKTRRFLLWTRKRRGEKASHDDEEQDLTSHVRQHSHQDNTSINTSNSTSAIMIDNRNRHNNHTMNSLSSSIGGATVLTNTNTATSVAGYTTTNSNTTTNSLSSPQITTTSIAGVEANELMMLLKDEIGWNLFYEYCDKEFSAENCECLVEIQKLQSKIARMNGKQRRQSCRDLHKKYFSGESIQQVNISGRARQMTKSVANSKVINLETANELLIQLRREVVTNLRDTFSRFVLTDEYMMWKEMMLNPESIFNE